MVIFHSYVSLPEGMMIQRKVINQLLNQVTK